MRRDGVETQAMPMAHPVYGHSFQIGVFNRVDGVCGSADGSHGMAGRQPQSWRI